MKQYKTTLSGEQISIPKVLVWFDYYLCRPSHFCTTPSTQTRKSPPTRYGWSLVLRSVPSSSSSPSLFSRWSWHVQGCCTGCCTTAPGSLPCLGWGSECLAWCSLIRKPQRLPRLSAVMPAECCMRRGKLPPTRWQTFVSSTTKMTRYMGLVIVMWQHCLSVAATWSDIPHRMMSGCRIMRALCFGDVNLRP